MFKIHILNFENFEYTCFIHYVLLKSILRIEILEKMCNSQAISISKSKHTSILYRIRK